MIRIFSWPIRVQGAWWILTDRKRCSQFDNDRVTLLFRSEPRDPLYMMQDGSCSIVDQSFSLNKYESEFEEGRRSSPRPGTDRGGLFTHIVWAPNLAPSGLLFDCIERPNELDFPIWPGHSGQADHL
ncbi:hypothetical protein HID58_090058 [Brassica napus]|uniref:Uncharacterized protein n=1 Tax=Brassica napus TaxID=3708 RepID=A0ABQ7XFZ8_BRANA|nr:hypothetical protein HID58_090058 [Brassica napus]